MLPLIAGGLALGGQLIGAKQEEEDARKRALQGLSQAYASGSYAAPTEMPEGPSALNMAGAAGLAGMDQAGDNDKAAKVMAAGGEDPNDFTGSFGDGLRAFMRGRG